MANELPMDPKSNTRVLFVPYRPGRSSSASSNGGAISQQKHAAREYHRKAKERRRSAKQDAANEEAIIEVAQSLDSTHRPILPRSRSSQSMASPLMRAMGAGRVDPFNSYSVKNLSPHAHEMLDYSLVYQWPVFAFANPGATIEDMKRHVMSRIMFSATSLYAVVFVGATHWAISQYGRFVPQENAMLRLNYKSRALKQMAHDVETRGPEVPNETLYTMLSLAAFGKAGEKLTPPTYKPNQSVLAAAHDLEFFSRLPVEWAHLRVMFHLLKERGGLPSMSRPGFALITGIYDILTSFQQLAVPAFPLVRSTKSLLGSWSTAENSSSHLAYTLGTSFNGLSTTPSFARLGTAINYVVEITLGYDRYEHSTPDAPILHQVIRARSAVIHDILSLPDPPPSTPIPTPTSSAIIALDTTIYSLSRLATFSYLLIALYPISRENGPHEELARRIQSLLENASLLNMWETHSSLLVWASMLGGIMAKDTILRPWYVEHINQSGIKHTLIAWPPVSAVLTGFLWLESECNREGKELWNETWNVTMGARAASV